MANHKAILAHYSTKLVGARERERGKCSLRGRRSKGKGKGIRARDHARGRREEGNEPILTNNISAGNTILSVPLFLFNL